MMAAVSRGNFGPQPEAAGESIPTTVVLGRNDQLISEADQQWAQAHLDDVRLLDTDHFVILRRPEAISRVIVEAFGP